MGRSKVLVGGSLVAVLALQAGVAFAKPLSPKQWKKQGNVICKASNDELDAIGNALFAEVPDGAEPTAEQVQQFVAQFIPIIDDAVSSIVALDEPAKLRKGVKQFAVAVDDALTTIESDPSLAFQGDNNPFAEVDKLATKLGLKVCASDD